MSAGLAISSPREPGRDRAVLWRRLLSRTRFGWWQLLCIVVSIFVALPVISVAASVFLPWGEEWQHLAETRLRDYLWNTFWLALGVGTITACLGTATAWLVTMCDFPGRWLLRWTLLLPLAVPAYLSAYAYTDLLQFSGPVQTWLRETFDWGRRDYWFPPVRSLGGAMVILSMALLPYVYLAARTAFVEQSTCALEAGRTLGRGPWRNFFTVAVPLARPSIAAGTALVLMETLADFGAVDYCAVDTFATGIYKTWKGLESPTTAAQLSTVLLIFVVVLVMSEQLARRRAKFHQATHRARPVHRVKLGWIGSAGALLVCGLPVLLGFVVPAGLFVKMAIEVGDTRALEVVTDFGRNSLLVAVIAAGVAAVLALLVTFGRRVSRGPITRLTGRLAGFGYALPGTVIAIGLLLSLGWFDQRLNDVTRALFGWTPGLVLTGSIAAIVIGYQTRFLGVALAMLESSLGRVRRSVDDAARSLGAGGLGMLLRVHLPLLWGSLLAALLLVFVDVVKELPATLMLRPFNFETLAVRVYQLASDERLEEASLGALAIIGMGIVPVILLQALLDRRRSDEAPAGIPAAGAPADDDKDDDA